MKNIKIFMLIHSFLVHTQSIHLFAQSCTMAFCAVNAFDIMTAEAPWNDET